MMKNLSMYKKLIILSFCTGILPILLISLLMYSSASKEMQQAVKKSNYVYSTLIKNQLASYFHERKGDGNLIADSDSVILPLVALEDKTSTKMIKGAAIDELGSFLTLTLNEYGYTNIFVTDETGEVIYSVNNSENLLGVDLSIRDYVKGSLNGDQTWSRLFYSDFLKTNVMVLSTPVYSHDNDNLAIGSINILFDQKN